MSAGRGPVEDFMVAARMVIRWAHDGGEPLDLLPALAQLLDRAFRLPLPEPTESDPFEFRDMVHGGHVQASVAARLSGDMYWTVPDRFDLTTEDVARGVGRISDDLFEIYTDLAHGFAIYEHGEECDAIWHWRFSFDTHWGRHLVDTIAALHHLNY